MTVQIAAVLLAGGENRRMRHQEKFSLPFQGSTFGGHLLNVLRETLPGVPVYLSVGSEKTQPETDVPCIPDECPNLGPAGGILSAMHRIAAEALLVLACDMPFVDGPLLQKLLRAYEQSRKLTLVCAADTDGLSAHADGRTLPFPGIYPLRLLPCFEQAAVQRDGALRRIIRQTEAAEGIERVCLPAQSRCLESVNTPYVYQALMGTLPPKKPATEFSDAVRLLREAVRQPAHDTAGDAKRKAALHPADETVLRTVPLLSALGEILAEDVFAVRDQPPFPRSPLDGYAVRAEDTKEAGLTEPVCLQVVGKIFAGETYPEPIRAGEALRLMTGAPMPAGADAVIRQEDTDGGRGTVRIFHPLKPWENYCFAGEEFRKGDRLLAAGTRLGAGALSVLAAQGQASVRIRSGPCVAVLSTGDEVLAPEMPYVPGKIYDANLTYLTARLEELAVPAAYTGHVGDDAEAIAESIRGLSASCRLILTTGGVSVGEKDIMHDVVRILNVPCLLKRVRLKPGGILLAFLYGHTLVLALSGNPFGAAAGFELLARPVLAELYGREELVMKRETAELVDDFSKSAGSRRFLRGQLRDGQVRICGKNHSAGSVSAPAAANCLIEIPPEQAGARAGENVAVYLL